MTTITVELHKMSNGKYAVEVSDYRGPIWTETDIEVADCDLSDFKKSIMMCVYKQNNELSYPTFIDHTATEVTRSG